MEWVAANTVSNILPAKVLNIFLVLICHQNPNEVGTDTVLYDSHGAEAWRGQTTC